MNLKNRYVRAVTLEGKGKLTLKDYPYPELKFLQSIFTKKVPYSRNSIFLGLYTQLEDVFPNKLVNY